MKLQLCSLELCKLAKNKGFDWDTLHATDGVDTHLAFDLTGETHFDIEDIKAADNGSNSENYLCPTLDLLTKWMRDVHELHLDTCVLKDKLWEYNVHKLSSPYHELGKSFDEYDTYEEAQEAALLKAFTLI